MLAVALQLPESDGHVRLIDKFPSDTTFWLILRKFEAGVAGGGNAKQNLTARGAPSFNQGSAASGRIYYQKPVIHVMGRELSSFSDLQKTLSQLGFTSGNVLLKLSFQMSDTPLEEAMEQMTAYFKDALPEAESEASEPTPSEAANEAPNETPNEAANEVPEPTKEPAAANNETEASELVAPSQAPNMEAPQVDGENPLSALITTQDSSTPDHSPSQDQSSPSGKRAVQVFSPPESNPFAAILTSHNPADYIPTIEHAKIHQRNLKAQTHNTRLPSEAELADAAAAETAKLQAVKTVEIKIRFPDQSAAVTTFDQSDTGADLYSFVRDECLDKKWKQEKFILVLPGVQKGSAALPDTAAKKLIQHLGLKQRVLITFKWDDAGGASAEALATKDVLNAERRREAQPIPQPQLPQATESEEEGVVVDLKGKDEGTEKKNKGIPKWLKLPGKK